MDDFDPVRVVDQIPALKALLESRNQLRDLLSKADRSEKLETLLEEILQDNDAVRRMVEELKAKGATEEAK